MNAAEALDDNQDAPITALEILQAASLGFASTFESAYKVGSRLVLSWNTPYELTTLELWQGLNDAGSFAVTTLAGNLTQSQTTFAWNATPFSDNDLTTSFHFRLQKGDLPNNCSACMANSRTFQVEDSTAATTALPESAAATATGGGGNSSGAAGSAPASQSPVAAEHAGLSQVTKLGIGLGVGLGCAFVAALIVSVFFCLRRRQQRRSAAALRANKSQRTALITEDAERLAVGGRYSSGTESWLTKSSEKTKSYHDPFEFQNEDGSMKPGWERLFGKNGVPQRSRSGRLLFRT